MLLLDRHLDGEKLSWLQYDTLIKLMLYQHNQEEEKLKMLVILWQQKFKNLRNALC